MLFLTDGRWWIRTTEVIDDRFTVRDNAAERLGKLAVTPKMTQNQFLLHHKEIAKRTCLYVLTLVTPENVSSVFSRITESAPKYGVFLDVFDIRQNPHLKNQNDPYSIDNTRYFTLI